MPPAKGSGRGSDRQALWGEVKTHVGTPREAMQSLLTAGRPPIRELAAGRRFVARLFSFARPYRTILLGGLLAVVAGAMVGLAGAYTWRYMIDAIVPGGNPRILGRTTLVLLGIYLTGGFIGVVSGYLLRIVGMRVTMDLRLRLYRHLQSLSMSFFSERRTGELVSRVMNDVASIRGIVSDDLAGLLRQLVLFVGALAIIIVTNWRLTAFMFVTVPVVSIFSIWLGRAVRRLSTQVTDEFAGATTVLEETISGIRTVRSFVREEYETKRFRGRLARLMAVAIRRLYLEIVFSPTISVLFFSTTVLIIWFGGREVLAGRLTTGELVVFIALSGTLGGSIRWVGGLWTRLQSVLGTLERLFQLLDVEPEIVDAPDAVELDNVAGRLTFDGVSFTYSAENPDTYALRRISLDVPPGQTLAVVGPSGAGKTTLVNLVPRFYDPTEGSVLVDGVDVRTVTKASLREQIGLVPQETHLFGGTIRDNILYGKLDASDEEMIEAARAANAHDFIAAAPRGYDTVVGERGTKLSGGQRQRLAIARALLKNPRILLLDEATSALDSESEKLVQEALERLMSNRTTLVIAHRLSTVKNANRIAVLQEGALLELGSHEELMARDGLYARLYRHQFVDSDAAAEPSPAVTAGP